MPALEPSRTGDVAVDADLIELWDRGRFDESVRLLLQRYGGGVRAALRRRFPSVRDDHVLLQGMHDAARSLLDAYQPSKGTLVGWFLFVAARRVSDILRGERQHRLRMLPLTGHEWSDHHATPAGELASEEFRLRVEEALGLLSPLERAVIEADIDTGKQACAARLSQELHTSEQSIYAARARARRKLLRRLSPLELSPTVSVQPVR
ncbi:MAG TPA: hypothetical protein VFW87_04250 [Pirellulales bacterium]|nr:hypothetical protein [Pirellulales bacterium]